MVAEVHQETIVGLPRQDLVGPGAGVDLEDFDDLGDVVLDVTRYAPLAGTGNLDAI